MSDKPVTYVGSIKGFNRQWASVTSLKTTVGKEWKIIGHQFECACGTTKKFLSAYFHDTHGAAVNALESHHCTTN
jgi:hypothetical protein